MKIYIVGSGKLATAILTSHLSIHLHEIIKWETQFQFLNEKALIVHAGSGRQLPECLNYCSKTNSTLIELSTGLATEKITPDFPLVICPNTSVLMLKTLIIFKAFGHLFEEYQIKITESHQSSKTSEAGTANAFADFLKFPHGEITSLREPEVQQNELGIPEQFLDKHAYHKLVIKDGFDQLTIETKILGHNAYVTGVKTILETVIKARLSNQVYSVLDILQ